MENSLALAIKKVETAIRIGDKALLEYEVPLASSFAIHFQEYNPELRIKLFEKIIEAQRILLKIKGGD